MSRGRAVLGAVTAVVVAWAGVCTWILDKAKACGDGACDWSLTERVLLYGAHSTIRLLPFGVAGFSLALYGVFAWYLFRVPRVATHEESVLAVRRLRRLLKECWATIASAVGIGLLLTTRRSLTGLLVVVAMVCVVFAIAYAGSMYRALQVQSYRHERGLARLSPRTLALIGVASFMTGLAFVGLFAFGAVARAAGSEIAP